MTYEWWCSCGCPEFGCVCIENGCDICENDGCDERGYDCFENHTNCQTRCRRCLKKVYSLNDYSECAWCELILYESLVPPSELTEYRTCRLCNKGSHYDICYDEYPICIYCMIRRLISEITIRKENYEPMINDLIKSFLY